MPSTPRLLNRRDRERALAYLEAEGRPLDRAVARLGEGTGGIDQVFEALSAFQNSDGGFGLALEPDFRFPASSPMATMVGVELLRELGAPTENEVARRAVRYLVESYEPDIRGWQDLPAESNAYPHAPWWHHEPDRRYGPQSHWANPGAQITASLWRVRDSVPEALLREATEAGLDALDENQEPIREYLAAGYDALATECADADTSRRIRERLLRDAPRSVATEAEQWRVEAFQPVWLVRNSDHFLAEPLRDLLDANLDYQIGRQSEAGCWEPNWIWFGQPAENFADAKRDWSSEQTALMLRIFRGHQRLET